MENSPDPLTKEGRFFLEPASPSHRQYEALRAYFVEGISSQLVAERFGYTAGSFRVLCHHFRRSQPDFFRDLKPGPRTQPKKDASRRLLPSPELRLNHTAPCWTMVFCSAERLICLVRPPG